MKLIFETFFKFAAPIIRIYIYIWRKYVLLLSDIRSFMCIV